MSNERWYIETYTMTGKISPAVVHGAMPETVGQGDKTRLKSLAGPGPRVRPGSIKQINEGHFHLTLAQLGEVYSQDGRFRST